MNPNNQISKFQEGAPDEEIERLLKFKFLTVKNSEKVNGEIRETQGGIMTGLGAESQTERMLSNEDAVSNQNQIPFLHGFSIKTLK